MQVGIKTIFDLSDEEVNTKEDINAEEIKKAKKLLESNGYIVKKWTLSMERDANECGELEEQGIDKDCCECSCSVCLMQL